MKIAILSANLGSFDVPIDPVSQDTPTGFTKVHFHRFTDHDFPPITGLTPRFQYRIPKLFGWQMLPDYDVYIWLDSSFSMLRADSTVWLLDKLGSSDMAFFKHPWRNSITEETNHIEEKLQEGGRYITSRYKNGLHKEQLAEAMADTGFRDTVLYTSTAFVYRNTKNVHDMLKSWWYYQSRYFTCDQIALPYVIYKEKINVAEISENQYETEYLTFVSKHK